MRNFNLFLSSTDTQALCAKFDVSQYALPSIERIGVVTNPGAEIYHLTPSNLPADQANTQFQPLDLYPVKTVFIGLPVPDEKALLGAKNFSETLLDEKGEITKDHIFIQVNHADFSDYALECYWDTENNDPNCETDEDIEIDYLAAPYSSVECVAQMIAQSKIHDDVKLDFFAINLTHDKELGFDEVQGRKSITVGELRAHGPKALLAPIDNLRVSQVNNQLEKKASSGGYQP